MDDRLDSWKEIAAFLKRDVTTVQRWEKREGMPVHRHLHDKMGSVYALRSELEAWSRTRRISVAGGGEPEPTPVQPEPAPPQPSTSPASTPGRARARWTVALLAAAVVLAAAVLWRLRATDALSTNPLAEATVAQVTDWDGTEQAAAISRDGRFVAFLADRDGRADLWVTQVGTGQFHNLTRDASWDLVNPSVRTLGFSPDGSMVTFWARKSGPSAEIGIWAVPILGGQPRPYLEGAAELDWSSDASRLVFHTAGPGDPMFVRDPKGPEDRQILVAPEGFHTHFPLWSMDDDFIYFVQGALPDGMDVWRIKPAGGAAERITQHDSRVSHPVFLDPRTLVYLATDSSGAGPWIYAVDVDTRVPRRVSAGLDTYTSLSASADGRRLVATLATTKATLWRLPLGGTASDAPAGSRVPLSTRNGFSPRLGPGYLLYVSSQGASDRLWKQQGDAATELWSAPDTRIVGGPAIDLEGARIAFSARKGGRTLLNVINADGTGARVVGGALEWRGAPAWAPDGRSLTAAALDAGVPRLFSVPLDGSAPTPLGREHAVDPVWSPDGRFVVFSGADVGTTFPVKALSAADGSAFPLPALSLSRGARRLRFLPGGDALVVLKGDIRHKNLWSIDLETGAEERLTDLPPDFEVRDFDVAPDGREIVLERAQAQSEIVLFELPPR